MRIRVVFGIAIVGLALPVLAGAQEPPVDAYVWAAACKDCHAAEYDAWAKTKHAKAIDRMSGDQKKGGECIGCHVTGPKQAVEADGKIVNANVQCESCHGAGKAHVEAAKAGNAADAKLAKKPAEKVCVSCHNDTSPHFRGFFYAALTGLVHKTK